METVMDADQMWLLNTLNATLDSNQDIRSSAEESLKQASLHPGFGVALAKVIINRGLPLGLRQLAAVLLKQYVKQHWQEGDKSFILPLASSTEKSAIRSLLLQSLDDPHGKICTAVSMAVASIAQYDWPEEWPELMTIVLQLINDRTNMNGVRGALRCLSLLSGDLDENLLPKLVPVLFPCLFDIISSPNVYETSMRRRAVAVLHNCISTLGVMSGVYEEQAGELIKPMLQSWLHQFSSILSHPVSNDDPEDWCLRMEVLKSISQLVQNFWRHMVSEIQAILGPLWQTLVSCLKVYELASIQGVCDSLVGRADSDGSEQSLETFVIQLFELLLTLVGHNKLAKAFKKHLDELAYYIIGYMQITENQAEMWVADPNQYACDEDDMQYSCRVSCLLLLEELVGAYKINGAVTVINAAKKRIEEAYKLKAAGSSGWWKLREAAVLAIGSISEQILDFQLIGHLNFNMETFLDDLLLHDIGSGDEYPFLRARAFWTLSRFPMLVNGKKHEQILYASMRALAMNTSPPVKVGACKALCKLLPQSSSELLRPHMENVFRSIAALLEHASDETLHLLLDTLQEAVKADKETSVAVEPFISPLVLNVWAKNISDPFISIDAVEVLEVIKNVPGCLNPLLSRVLPTIKPILANAQHQPSELVAGTLDLLTMLIKNSPSDIVQIIGDGCFHSVISIILQSNDHSELQNATEFLSAFVLWGKEVLLNPGADANLTVKRLLDAAARLLDPHLDSSGSLFVGTYILQLILHLPSYLAMYMKDLITALVRRLETAEIAGLKNSLLLVFARLVHLSMPNIDQFIDLLISIPANAHQNSLHYVMSEWTKQQGEIHGSYQIKVTITALCHLLSSQHPELYKVQVQGHLVPSTLSGIVTRSRSKEAPDQWTTISLPSKMLSLLAQMLIEIQEQNANADEEDDEWEELEDGEHDVDASDFVDSISSTGPTVTEMQHLKDMLKEDEDVFEDDPLTAADPLNEIETRSYTVSCIQSLFVSNKQLFHQLWQGLLGSEKQAIESSLQCGGPLF